MVVEIEEIGIPPDGMINPVLVDNLNEMVALVKSATSSQGKPTHEEYAKKLCEGSRTVLFRLGPPGWVSREMRDYIAELFQLAADAMDGKTAVVRKYAKNVRNRITDVKKPARRKMRV